MQNTIFTFVIACAIATSTIAATAFKSDETLTSTDVFSIPNVTIDTDGPVDLSRETASMNYPATAVQPGEVVFDLNQTDIDLSNYDELWFDLETKNGPVDVSATTWGFPDSYHSRRWFYKRFPSVGSVQTIRYQFDLDDDRSLKKSKQPQRSITLRFTRPADVIGTPAAKAEANVSNIQLVKNNISVDLDPRQVSTIKENNQWITTHPITFHNQTEKEITVDLELNKSFLKHGHVLELPSHLSLNAGEKRTLDIKLAMPAESNASHPTIERVELEVKLPNGQSILPWRGYRPIYLYAIQPPKLDKLNSLVIDSDLTEDGREKLEASLDWSWQIPTDVMPRYEDHFRCKKCGFRLVAEDMTHYKCANKECEAFNKIIEVETDDPLFASYISIRHKQNAALARHATVQYLETSNTQWANLAKQILISYAEHFDKLPMVSEQSTGFRTRLNNAVLFTKEPLLDFTDAFLILLENDQFTTDEKNTIRKNLLTPLIYNLNLHHYGYSAGQINFILATLKAAVATNKWWFFADALKGDAGVETILDRGFDQDGIGVEGGAYAKSAAERITQLQILLKTLNADLFPERIAQILSASTAVGLLPGKMETTVLSATGYAVLANGSGPTRRVASVNWGRPRERGEHDIYSVTFSDPHGPLIELTDRIAYGNEKSKLMTSTVAENIPFKENKNIKLHPRKMTFFEDSDKWVGCILQDIDRPSYGDVTVNRAIILARGVLLIIDKLDATTPCILFQPIYGSDRLAGFSGFNLQKLNNSIFNSKPHSFLTNWRKSTRPSRHFSAYWTNAEGQDTTKVYYAGDQCNLLAAQTFKGWTAKPADILLLKNQTQHWLAGFAYESMRTDAAKIRQFHVTERKENVRAKLTFDDGATIQMTIMFSSEQIPASIEVDMTRVPNHD